MQVQCRPQQVAKRNTVYDTQRLESDEPQVGNISICCVIGSMQGQHGPH
jgi:hypothetical protein